jgi:hypothetical protein
MKCAAGWVGAGYLRADPGYIAVLHAESITWLPIFCEWVLTGVAVREFPAPLYALFMPSDKVSGSIRLADR